MEDSLEEGGRQDKFAHWKMDNTYDGKTWVEIEKISLLVGGLPHFICIEAASSIKC